MHFDKFSPKAMRFILRKPEEDAAINILTGSVRSGKTVTMIPKLISLCDYKVSGKRFIIGQSKQSLYRNVLSDLFDTVGRSNYDYNLSSGELRLFRSKWTVLGCGDIGQVKALQGSTAGLAYIDEGALVPEPFWDMLQTRLSVAGARLYTTTNPGPASHYLWKRYLNNPEFKATGQLWSETFVLDDNSSLPDEYKQRLRAQYAPGSIFWQRFIEGKWVSAEGAIYAHVWNDDVFFDEETAPDDLHGRFNARYVVTDYGTVNQQVNLQVVDDGTTLWVTGELVHDSRKSGFQKTDAQYADDLIAWMHPDSQVIVDPSAASYQTELRSRGISVRSGDNEVLDGIRVTSTALSRRLLRVHKDKCPTLCEQMPVYVWDTEAATKGIEKPLKVNDHGPDALRYGAKSLLTGYRLAA